MKLLARAAIAVLSFVATSVAYAGFSYSLTGPAVATTGDRVTFELTGIYTPIDLSVLPEIPPMDVTYFHTYASSAIPTVRIYKDGAFQWTNVGDPFVGWDSLITNTSDGLFDLGKPAEFKSFFSWTATESGAFDFNFSGRTNESYTRDVDVSAEICQFIACHAYVDSYDYRSGFNISSRLIVSAVPEPSSYLLMLFGVVTISAAVRRRSESRKNSL